METLSASWWLENFCKIIINFFCQTKGYSEWWHLIILLVIWRSLNLFCYNNNAGQIDDKTMYTLSPRLKAFSDQLLKVMASNLEAIFPYGTSEYAPFIEELWRDPSFQSTYNRRNELDSLPRVASYFLERVRSPSLVVVCQLFQHYLLVYL